MKKMIGAALAIGALAVPSAASASADGGNAYGQQIKAEFGVAYGQVLNTYRGQVLPGHGTEPVVPPASGAKRFWEAHGS